MAVSLRRAVMMGTFSSGMPREGNSLVNHFGGTKDGWVRCHGVRMAVSLRQAAKMAPFLSGIP